MFAPDIWNVHTVTIENGHHTNNSCEAWNHGFHEMLGHDHPSVWVVVETIQKDQALVLTALLKTAQGVPPQKRRRMATENVLVISRRVVGRAEETSTHSSLGFCTVNCRLTASNYQLSHMRLCRTKPWKRF